MTICVAIIEQKEKEQQRKLEQQKEIETKQGT